jgi:hypothetical protein
VVSVDTYLFLPQSLLDLLYRPFTLLTVISAEPDKELATSAAPSLQPGKTAIQFTIALVLLAGLTLRFINFTTPPFDAHSFRQTETLFTIETFYQQGIDLLHPKTNYTGYPGTLVLEFPIFQAFVALLYHVFGPHLELIRILNILFGAATGFLLFKITKRLLDPITAWLAVLIYWLSPLNITYQRSMLIDPAGVTLALLVFYQLLFLLPAEQTSPRAETDSPRPALWRWTVFFVATILTALIKALYLWPAVLLIADRFFRRRCKLDARIFLIGSAFSVAGSFFILWNVHATHVNDLSPFTRGTRPTSHLGVSALFDPHFYRVMLWTYPKYWLGLAGLLLYPFGFVAAWRERFNRTLFNPLLILLLIPPTYLLAFASINMPHDYYQLIIVPFLSIASATGLRWLWFRYQDYATRNTQYATRFPAFAAGASLFLLLSLGTYFWYHSKVWPEALRFQELCAPRVQAGQSAMLFVDQRISPGVELGELPAFLYSVGFWGCGKRVRDIDQAKSYFEKFYPDFPGLQYLVFYGVEKPDWVPTQQFHPEANDEANHLFIFRRNAG